MFVPSPDTLNTMATRSSVGISAIVVAGDGRTETLLLAALIVFAGYTAFGVTGFGASPITVPVLAHFLPLPFVLTLAAALDLGSSVALGLHTKTAPVARTVGTDRIVDELIYRCTHTIEMPWILPRRQAHRPPDRIRGDRGRPVRRRQDRRRAHLLGPGVGARPGGIARCRATAGHGKRGGAQGSRSHPGALQRVDRAGELTCPRSPGASWT